MLMASNVGASALGTRISGPFTPIARQTSIFSLTLDELQNTYEGKNFGSMNMDEFLKNIWTAEESQAMASALASTNEANNPKPSASAAPSGGLARQGSLSRQVSLPGALSRKTVDEVWKDIQRGSQVKPKELQQQVSYGEMTLEDFLVKAGVVRDESDEAEAATAATPADVSSRASGSFPFGPGTVTGGAFQEASTLARANHQATMDAIAVHNHQQTWLNYQLKATQMQQHHFLQQQAAEAAAAAYENAKRSGGLPLVAMPGTSSGSGMEGSSDGGVGHGNGLSPTMNTPDSSSRGRKRNHEDVVEKTVERRQRRMIKNRESAARSRARKQAYTVELEAEVTQLKEENTRLKAQQMLDKLIPITEASPPKKVLRRTKTNPW